MLNDTPLTALHYRLAVKAYARRLDMRFAALHIGMTRAIYFFAGLTGESTPQTFLRCESPWFETELWSVYGVEVHMPGVPEYVLLFHADGKKHVVERDMLIACGPYDEAMADAVAWTKARRIRDPRVAYAKRLVAAMDSMGDATADEYLEVCRRGRTMVQVWKGISAVRRERQESNKRRWMSFRLASGDKVETISPITGKPTHSPGVPSNLAKKKRNNHIYNARRRGDEPSDDGIHEPRKRGRPRLKVRRSDPPAGEGGTTDGKPGG